jgi:peptidyl-prolyl cis-trans isomerase C
MQKTRFIMAAILTLSLAAVPLVSWAQDTTAGGSEDPVVARVNGEALHQSDLMRMAESLPPQYQANLAQILPMLLERLIDLELVGKAGRDAGLADDAVVKQRLVEAETEVIREVYLERLVAEKVTDETVKGRYEVNIAANPPKEERRARHILLENKEDAQAVIEELKGGADFATLAQDRSTGPSGPQGGDLGYFTPEQMVPEFAEVAFTLEPGSYSKEPVETQFGFHVIMVEDSRMSAPPALAEMEDQIREELTAEVVGELLVELRSGAEIEVIGVAPPEGGEAAQ